ncbi:CLUMA_CG012626, isoform A [Clunio marinus]|uniref:CLUMA_CG012626, isoform A n=1 Tax=Clunio marinus TaxID=568069 RepID=A0A1J1IG43_9DIPT|nr:CLUMA_CG012626, isoform A [Clunio marinus]
MPLDYCCEPRRPCPPLDCNGPLCSPYNRGYRQPPRRESFKPVSKYQRPLIPMTTDTVYRKSFECVDSQITACCRPPPYVPNGQLQLPCGGFAKDTITRMSFQQACQPERVRPFNPKTSFTFGCGELQKLTTQKHDFVPKFQCKQPMSVPRNNIGNCCGRMENGTVQKLSFQHPCVFTRTQSCKPIIHYKQPELPMECETTQKLSFQPVCPPPKEDYPWARKARYCPPEVKFARDTVAKLSYQPPGCFIDENKICCEMPCEEYPKASC